VCCLFLCASALLPLPARAGQWTISYSQALTESYLRPDYYNPSQTTFVQHSWQRPPVSSTDNNYSWYIGYRWYESENLDLAGSDAVLATITWQPAPGMTLLTDPPPAKLTLIETAHSWWGAFWNEASPPTAADGQASDGLGDPMVFTVSPNSTSCFGTSSGRHLIQVDGSSGVVKIPCILSAQNPTSAWVTEPNPSYPAYSTSFWSWSPNSIEYTFNVVQDSRAVTISADVDPTLAKGPRYNGDHSLMFDIYGDELFTPHPHAPTADGTMYGDIGLDDTDGPSYNTTDITYSGGRAGNWHIDGDTDFWFHNLPNSAYVSDHQGESLTFLSPDISDFSVQYNGYYSGKTMMDAHDMTENSTIGTDHVHLTYTDGSDGAIATANYYMDIHRSWEWTASKKPADGFWRNVALTVANPGDAGNNGTISCTWSEDNPFVAEASVSNNDLVAGAFTVAGAATPSPGLNALLTFIGFSVDKFGPKPDSGTADFNGCWNDPNSTFSTPPPANYWTMTPQQQNAFRQYYTMVPYLFLHYTTNYYLADNWGSNGYIAQVPKAFATLDMRPDGSGPGAMDWCGAFQFNGDTKTPQPPTHGN